MHVQCNSGVNLNQTQINPKILITAFYQLNFSLLYSYGVNSRFIKLSTSGKELV